MTAKYRNPHDNSVAEQNCRIDQITDGFLDNVQLAGRHSYGKEAARFAELVVLNELIFGSPDQAVQELVAARAQRKTV
jgi:hypothetical protein